MAQIQPIIFGEVLFDCFPNGTEVLGGAPFNVAWHLRGFDLLPVFISRVGKDQKGKKIYQAMRKWGMNTDYLQYDSFRPTGTVEIKMEQGEPSYKISPDDAYGYIQYNNNIKPLPANVPLLYHGTLALWSLPSRNTLNAIKQQYKVPIFVDVNLRPPWWKKEIVFSLLNGSNWVKMNEEELGLLFPLQESYEEKAKALLRHFQCDLLILTRGSRGATVFSRNDQPTPITPKPALKIIDTVGAGDAFSAVFILGLTAGWPVKKTIRHAQEFASIIVEHRGAVISDHNLYSTLLSKWIAS